MIFADPISEAGLALIAVGVLIQLLAAVGKRWDARTRDAYRTIYDQERDR